MRVRSPASFSTSLTITTLRFAQVVATNFLEDLHLQVDVHAGHTSKAGTGSSPCPLRVHPTDRFLEAVPQRKLHPVIRGRITRCERVELRVESVDAQRWSRRCGEPIRG